MARDADDLHTWTKELQESKLHKLPNRIWNLFDVLVISKDLQALLTEKHGLNYSLVRKNYNRKQTFGKLLVYDLSNYYNVADDRLTYASVPRLANLDWYIGPLGLTIERFTDHHQLI